MKIKIGGHQYDVVVKEIPEKDNDLATCDYCLATINIDKNIVVQTIRESSFIHGTIPLM